METTILGRTVFVAPSILSADFGRLNDAVRDVNVSEAHFLHCDVMDGVFVPNISFGFPILAAIKKISIKPLDVHLMITSPERYILPFKQAGADILTVHQEACVHLHRTLSAIREAGMKAGVALNPATPIETIGEVLQLIDVVCLMSVNPGFGGQKFIPHTYEKIRKLRILLTEANAKAAIEIDGGVSADNADELAQAGADILVAGNAIFAADDPRQAIGAIHTAANRFNL